VTEPGPAAELNALGQAARADGRRCVVGAIIVNARGELYLQRRAPTARLFPGCWDIVGGHVEPDETPFEALVREVAEETGWRLASVGRVVAVFDWTAEHDGVPRREIDVLATVTGDLDHPKIERGAFTEARWLDAAACATLQAAAVGSTAMIDLALRALALSPDP
jgi:8-oxo-dGTP pyrophosphatase MutT (NUDIX family)